MDTIEVDINTEYEIVENNHDFLSPKTGLVVGTLKLKQGKQHGYRLNICLPKCVHETNIKPLSVLDVYHLFEITEMITKQMQDLFGKEFPELIVSTCEVNTTVMLQNKSNVQPLLNMIASMMLQKDRKLCIWCHGKHSGERYKQVNRLHSGMQVESIKTPQLPNARLALKIYDKGEEQNIQDEGIIRFETIYSRSGLDYAKAGRTLQEFLTVKSIENLIRVYRADYKKYFIDAFWNNQSGKSFYKECETIIYNDLKKLNGQPLTVALMNRTIIEWDFALFQKACKRYYENPDSARQAIYRVRKSNEIEIHEHVIDDFVQISKSIVYG
ncbi:MAG: hypothetical protein SOU03_12900 [Dorea sp.]|nr:hypothetical protein [Dorea sp.]